jgi:hypothetical protein
MAISVSMLASRCCASIQAFLNISLPLPNTTAVDRPNSSRRSTGDWCISMPETITGAVSSAAWNRRLLASASRAFSRSTIRRRCASVSIGRAS